MAGVGLTPRVNDYGQQLCEKCGTRLNRVKHTTKCSVGKKCHPRCKSKGRVTDSLAPPLSTPIRSHKRKESPTGQQQSTPSLIIAPPPPHCSWNTHGASVRSSSRTSRATAASWWQLACDSELDKWEKKRGGHYQHDTTQSLKCSFLDEKRVRLRHSAESIARAELTAIGVNATTFNLAAMKLLRSSKGEGEQDIHYDITEYARAIRCFTVLMYLTDTLSTAVPELPLKQIRHYFTDGQKRPSAAAVKFLSRNKFKSERVAAGDMLILNCAVPHYGVANPDEKDRYVLFLLFFPSTTAAPDTEEQRYPHGVSD